MARTNVEQRIANNKALTVNESQTLRAIALQGAGQIILQDSAFSVTSSTTLANVTGMSYNMTAGRWYKVRVVGSATNSGGTQGVKAALNLSGTQTTANFEGYARLVNGSTTVSAGDRVDANTVTIGAAVAEGLFEFDFIVRPQNDGLLTLQFAQSVSGATASILAAYTRMEVYELTFGKR